ncbi:hypothetical protein DPMN_048237 [Dreissena polymorpha]|uniref:Uncharacterized protein n=2 Tax=Dreissena polymorpha TaxID=45954 RepID=A0A9D4DAA6_DREPO|nr:hypothetical protein DPMN_048237 [Dreissena polymorpha]
MPMKSKERTAELTHLRNAGNYKHNVSVLKEESGEFFIVARKTHDKKPEDYLPCDDCLGFFLREGLWRHKQVCPLRNPSLALKIGHLLKKCAKVAKSEALIIGDLDQGTRANNFLTLCNDEWADEISSCALQTLTKKQDE